MPTCIDNSTRVLPAQSKRGKHQYSQTNQMQSQNSPTHPVEITVGPGRTFCRLFCSIGRNQGSLEPSADVAPSSLKRLWKKFYGLKEGSERERETTARHRGRRWFQGRKSGNGPVSSFSIPFLLSLLGSRGYGRLRVLSGSAAQSRAAPFIEVSHRVHSPPSLAAEEGISHVPLAKFREFGYEGFRFQDGETT